MENQPNIKPPTILDWPSNSEGAQMKFVKIDRNNQISVCINETIEKSTTFWTSFNRKYGFNLIRGIPNK
jgi:hypothetical protein